MYRPHRHHPASAPHPLPGSFPLSPLTVLVDPARAANLYGEHLSFLFGKQREEADLICYTKTALGFPLPPLPIAPVRRLSAKTGQGVAAWLDEVLSGQLTTSHPVLDIDYEQYAQAEAALAWLNLTATMDAHPPVSPAQVLGPLLDDIDAALANAGIPLVHLKATDTCDTSFLKAALTAPGQEPAVEGALDASPAIHHELLLNLRAVGPPHSVQTLVTQAAHRHRFAITHLNCFQPAPPRPEHRWSPSPLQ